jgi:hypothetical protein
LLVGIIYFQLPKVYQVDWKLVVNLNIISIILFPLFAILYMERVYRMTFEMIHEVYAIL